MEAQAVVAELELHLKASYKLIHLRTQEEKRAEEHLRGLARSGSRAREYFSWRATDGVSDAAGKPVCGPGQTCPNKDTRAPEKALQWVMDREAQRAAPALYVMKDLHPFVGGRGAQALTLRKLKDCVQVLEETYSAVVLLGPQMESIPVELEKELVVIDFPLPGLPELRGRLVDLINDCRSQPGVTIDVTEDDITELARAAKGLTLTEADLAFGKAITRDRRQPDGSVVHRLERGDVAQIIEEKKQIVRKSGTLTFEEPGDMGQVGGLEVLKQWLGKRRDVFTEEARRYGLAAPKGVLLTGVPGCGKSLCAKSMASFWNIPILRLDMGSIFGGLVGASEANIRRAVQVAEAMSPCILMIDEIEKGLAGSSGQQGDGGTATRVFGTLLSWMNDKTAPVFVVATANQFEQLPPEMLRKGRFDELFFVDFPHAAERRQILEIHVAKALSRRDPPPAEGELREAAREFGFDREFTITRAGKSGAARTERGSLVQLSQNFTGSEIEEAVKTAMIEAFADGRRPVAGADVAQAISQTVPLIDTMAERIEAIRARARECTVAASKYPAGDEAPAVVAEEPPPAAGAAGPGAGPGDAPPAPSRGGRRMFDMK